MIYIHNLYKRYGKKVVADHITLPLENQVYGLVGPNGAGKTTLIRLLAGVISPNAGHVSWKETKDKKRIHGKIGYLPQKFGCFPELTVYEQLEYLAYLKRIPLKMVPQEIERVLSMVNLEDRRNVRCSKLSGGMVQRVGVAQALLFEPELLLLDEPAVGLDPEERSSFNNILKQLNNRFPILYSTHMVEDVKYICQQIIVMDQGRIRMAGDGNAISGAAAGMVFQGPLRDIEGIREPYYIEKYTDFGTEQGARILFLEPGHLQYDFLEEVSPNAEDGYLAIMKGVKQK